MLKFRQWLAWLLVLLVVSVAGAAGPEYVLAPPQEPIRGGETVALNLYVHNPSDTDLRHELPLSLRCQIRTRRSTVKRDAELVGQKEASSIVIPAQGVVQRKYALTLPVYAEGPVRIIPENADTRPLTVTVGKASPEAWHGQQVPLDEGAALAQSFIENLSIHEPLYFLLGVDPGIEQSKFQFSFKYRLFNPEGWIAASASWLPGFHFGYTQRSVWDLKSTSKPFDDTSYMPELFYLLPTIHLNTAAISTFGIQGGFQHESNGKGGDDSRSTNYVYLKPVIGFHLMAPFQLMIAPKIYTYFENEDETNADLKDYRGYVDLEVSILDPGGIALNSHLWWADQGSTVQLDLTYPMTELLGKNLNFYLHAQYFSGYAETLLNYQDRHDVFRLGFSIVR